MKILLIDDNGNKGWEQILRKIFPIDSLAIQLATTYNTAIEKLKNDFDLIFLDIRLDTNDHHSFKIEDYSGYKVLKEIKKDFKSINFSTPIILLTASNKIWNIDAFRNYGVDAYYIKEHPDFIFDKETSKQNYNNLKQNFERLIFEGVKRKEIWNLSFRIIEIVTKHHYFKSNTQYSNVKNRIIDKLKLGYVYLFKEQNTIERELLKTNNEALSFIVYWSILEELVKGLTDLSSWNNNFERNTSWKFRNGEYFIEEIKDGIKVNIDFKKQYLKRYVEIKSDSKQYKDYSGLINLSTQLYSLLAAYSKNNDKFTELSVSFSKINDHRNEIDFIHSKVKSIFKDSLININNKKETYEYIIKVLKFIEKVLQLI